MRARSLLWISGLSLALGCSAGPDAKDLPGASGKADGVVAECSYSTPFVGGSDSSALAGSVVAAAEVGAGDIGALSDLQKAQLLAAAVHLEAVEPGSVIEAVFEAADEGTVELLDVTVADAADGQSFDWVRFYLGDTEVGVVFENESLAIAAEIGDGDVLGCTAPATPDELQQSFDADVAGLLEGKGLVGLVFEIPLPEVQMQADLDSGVAFPAALGAAVDGLLGDGGLLLAFTEGGIARAEGCPELPFAESLVCTIGKVGDLRLVGLAEDIDGVNAEDEWVFELGIGASVYYAAVSRSDDTAPARIVSAN